MINQFKPCTVENCGGNAHKSANGSSGYCCAHYGRFWRHGDPLGGRRTLNGEPARFIEKVALPYSGDDCLVWPYGKDEDGYGKVSVNGKIKLAHRYVCTIVHGEPPSPEHHAAHSCGNGHLGCVNPGHLEWKTPAGNMADKLIHDTHNRGERHVRSKLTENDVLKILALRGVKMHREIAAEFGISEGYVSIIHAGRKWSWLGGSPK